MAKQLTFLLLIIFLSFQAYGQLTSDQEDIRDSFKALLELSEDLPSSLDTADVPSQKSLVSPFLDSLGVDTTAFFSHFTRLVESVKSHAEFMSIDLNSSDSHELVFDGLIIDHYSGSNYNVAGIPGPTFCYDRFVEDMQIVGVEAVVESGVSLNLKAGAIDYLVGWITVSNAFDRCIGDNY